MSRRRDRNVNGLSKAPLLPSESSEDFESLYAALEEEIKPRGIIERLYLEDFANIVWEIWRLRRCKSAIVNRAFRPALRDLTRAFRRRWLRAGRRSGQHVERIG